MSSLYGKRWFWMSADSFGGDKWNNHVASLVLAVGYDKMLGFVVHTWGVRVLLWWGQVGFHFQSTK